MFRYFESRVNPFPDAPVEQPPSTMMAFLRYYSRPMLPWLVVMGVLTALASVVEITFISYIGSLVDWLSEASRETVFAEHGRALLGMAALVLAYPVLVLLHSLVTHQTIFGNFPMLARWLSHRYVLGQSMSFFQNEFAGRVSQKVMQTALAMRETVMKLIDLLAFVLVYFIGTLYLVGGAEPWLMLPLAVWLVAYLATMVYFVPRLRKVSIAQANARAQMTGRVVDSYSNIQTVKLFAHTRWEQDYAHDAMEGFIGTVHRQMRLVTGLTVALQSTNALLLAAVAGLAVFAWQQAAITLGAIAVAITLVMRIRSMSEQILWQVAGLFENIGTVQDGMNTIARPRRVQDRSDAAVLTAPEGSVEFDRVRFSYDRESPVIDDLALTIRPGEKVGIVGRSGAGKSTLVNLLLRFYDLEEGAIRIDGRDISHVTQESLRKHIGMVTQDTALLHRSIRENILYGRPDAGEAEMLDAAHRAHAYDFIQDLVDSQGRHGFDAYVGERGVNLSGGQRQRIAIARVLLKDAPLLVLDEATAALDSEVEAAIQAQLDTLMEGKTVMAIAHRLSTIAVLDRLVVVDRGRVIENGTHEELLAAGGLYAALWARQSGGFIGEDTGDEEAIDSIGQGSRRLAADGA